MRWQRVFSTLILTLLMSAVGCGGTTTISDDVDDGQGGTADLTSDIEGRISDYCDLLCSCSPLICQAEGGIDSCISNLDRWQAEGMEAGCEVEVQAVIDCYEQSYCDISTVFQAACNPGVNRRLHQCIGTLP